MTSGIADRLRRVAFRATVALGLVGGLAASTYGSNLGPDGYPAHACGVRPAVPERPEKFTTEEQVKTYNAAVESYNDSMQRFVECIQAYVDGASEDIKRIKIRAQEAIDQAK